MIDFSKIKLPLIFLGALLLFLILIQFCLHSSGVVGNYTRDFDKDSSNSECDYDFIRILTHFNEYFVNTNYYDSCEWVLFGITFEGHPHDDNEDLFVDETTSLLLPNFPKELRAYVLIEMFNLNNFDKRLFFVYDPKVHNVVYFCEYEFLHAKPDEFLTIDIDDDITFMFRFLIENASALFMNRYKLENSLLDDSKAEWPIWATPKNIVQMSYSYTGRFAIFFYKEPIKKFYETERFLIIDSISNLRSKILEQRNML